MFWELADKAGRVIGPVLIHYLVANIVGMMRLHADAAFLTSMTAVLVLPLFWRMYRNDRILYGREAPKKMKWQDYLGIAALGIACNIALTLVMNVLLSYVPVSNEVQENLFQSNLLIQLFGVGILVPFMEEVLFRGLVYNRLRGYTRTAQPAMVLAAVIFAVYHGNIVQMLFAFPMALIMTALYQRWNTLKASTAFHMAVNLSSVLITAILSSK